MVNFDKGKLPSGRKSNEKVFVLECNTEVTASQLSELTGWKLDRCYKRLKKSNKWEDIIKEFRPRTIIWKLDDGSTITAPDLAKKIDCSNSTAFLRLQKTSDPARLFRPIETKQQRTDCWGARIVWEDKEVQVIMGIPVNPSYMDGTPNGCLHLDRDGKKMTFREISSLVRYRLGNREEWLEDKNKRETHELVTGK
jgi:hypothetical protein